MSSMKHDYIDYDYINPLDAGNAHSRCIYQPAKKFKYFSMLNNIIQQMLLLELNVYWTRNIPLIHCKACEWA